MGLEGICALYSFKIDPPRPDMLRGGMRPLALDPYNRNADNLRRTLEKPDIPKPTPPGEEFGLPSPWIPPKEYGISG